MNLSCWFLLVLITRRGLAVNDGTQVSLHGNLGAEGLLAGHCAAIKRLLHQTSKNQQALQVPRLRICFSKTIFNTL